MNEERLGRETGVAGWGAFVKGNTYHTQKVIEKNDKLLDK
jgi:hypothetical protein